MKNKKTILTLTGIGVIALAVFFINLPCSADENVEDLKKQIVALQEEVAQLKAEKSPTPNVTTDHEDFSNFWNAGMFDAWNPFAEMQMMQDRMNRLFRDSFRRSAVHSSAPGTGWDSFYEPDLAIQDEKDHYRITLDLPGMDKDQIHIDATDNDLVISGQRNVKTEDKDNVKGFYRMEQRFGSFSRRIPLPENATPEGISAKYDKGVLEIKLPKKIQEEPKKEVKRVKIA